jgi:hypothetical protein
MRNGNPPALAVFHSNSDVLRFSLADLRFCVTIELNRVPFGCLLFQMLHLYKSTAVKTRQNGSRILATVTRHAVGADLTSNARGNNAPSVGRSSSLNFAYKFAIMLSST